MTCKEAYAGTAQRTFSQAVVQALETGYGLLGSRRVLELIAADVKALVEEFYPVPTHISSGWMVFTGVKATGSKTHPGQSGAAHQLVVLAWPVVLTEDLEALAAMPTGSARQEAQRKLLQRRIVRIVEYGQQHPKGPVLLTLADLSAMLNLNTVRVSKLLKEARKETGKPLLTKGYFFDQGMRPTHKAEIIALYESGLDEVAIARQSHHHSSSVGKYIRDYERTKLLLKNRMSIERIIYLTGMQPSVVKFYVSLVYQYHPTLKGQP